MATEPQHSETMSGAPASSEPADVGANAALILAALGRIEAVVRDERAALASLRAALGEMAQAIARAKAVADSENAAAMLDEFEHRVDAMIEIAGGMPEAGPPATESVTQPAAESDQVPTVSGVVLRLGPGDVAPEPATAEAEPPADAAGDKGPTVAMLTAMVEALSASIQTPAPEPDAEVAAPAAQAIEPPPPALEMAPEFTAAPVEAEVAATAMPEPEPVAEAEPASLPGEALAQETTLLASFEQMETRPFPPPEEGTAVIFTSKFEPVAEPEAISQAEHGFAPLLRPNPRRRPSLFSPRRRKRLNFSRSLSLPPPSPSPNPCKPPRPNLPRWRRLRLSPRRPSPKRSRRKPKSHRRNPNSIRPTSCSVPSRNPIPPRSCSMPRRRRGHKRPFCRRRNSSLCRPSRSNPKSRRPRTRTPSRRKPKSRRQRGRSRSGAANARARAARSASRAQGDEPERKARDLQLERVCLIRNRIIALRSSPRMGTQALPQKLGSRFRGNERGHVSV